MKWILVFLASSTLFLNNALSVYRPQVVYGEDNRKDLFEVQDLALLTAAKSTSAIFSKFKLKKSGTVFQVSSASFREEFNMCSNEPFAHQQAGAKCSAFLVGSQMMATAGHCINSGDCGDTAFVFDFAYSTVNAQPQYIPEEKVYYCSRILKRELNGQEDYALVLLDRAVTDRDPLKLASTQATEAMPLTVIGHPAGIPTKIADGAEVRSSNEAFFVSNLDTYGGNSGSAVFNSETMEVLGILVRGERDYTYDSVNKCFVSNNCLQ
ncbi:MAG: trypsin-like serine peptidase [Bdellovibrionales bacterium]